MNPEQSYVGTIEALIKAMVFHPEEVKIDTKVDERGVLLTVNTRPEDRGKVIGKGGQTALALRTIAHVIGAAHECHLSILIAG